jgi:hypothetical protein
MFPRAFLLLLLFLPALSLTPQAALAGELPTQADLRTRLADCRLAPGVQGARNTCSLFAIAGLAEWEAANSGERPPTPLSPEFLTWAANAATGRRSDQAMFYEALCGLNAFGICPAESMPYEQAADQDRRPPDDVLAHAAELAGRWRIHWIKLWDVAQPLSDRQMRAIKAALADDHPVACGLRWPHHPRGPDIRDVPPAEQVYDGHSIVFVGYRDDPDVPGGGAFVFRNSYGVDWGDGGYATMSYAYARAYANDALWIELRPPGSEVPRQRFEAETLTVSHSERCDAAPQLMRRFGGPMWSGRKQLHCRAGEGGWVELAFDVPTAGRFRVRLLGTAAPDYGRIRVTLNGAAVESEFDLYSGRVCPAGSLELGRHDLPAGSQRLRLDVVGKAPAASGHAFGLDALDILAAAD